MLLTLDSVQETQLSKSLFWHSRRKIILLNVTKLF